VLDSYACSCRNQHRRCGKHVRVPDLHGAFEIGGDIFLILRSLSKRLFESSS
jgi:hypothetical protein